MQSTTHNTNAARVAEHTSPIDYFDLAKSTAQIAASVVNHNKLAAELAAARDHARLLELHLRQALSAAIHIQPEIASMSLDILLTNDVEIITTIERHLERLTVTDAQLATVVTSVLKEA